jgi:hypothetical protein
VGEVAASGEVIGNLESSGSEWAMASRQARPGHNDRAKGPQAARVHDHDQGKNSQDSRRRAVLASRRELKKLRLSRSIDIDGMRP